MIFNKKMNSISVPHYWQRIKGMASCTFSQCDLCTSKSEHHALLCDNCLADLPFFSNPYTATNLLHWPAINQVLPRIKFDRLICVAPHIWPFEQWINQFKYQGRIELSSLLSFFMTKSLQPLLNEIPAEDFGIISVPLHVKRWQARGFNQAHILAKQVAKRAGIKYYEHALTRQHSTDSQVGQSGKQRRVSLRGAFSLNKDALPQQAHLILVDDVITTGATTSEICQLLKGEGFLSITVVSVSLALPEH